MNRYAWLAQYRALLAQAGAAIRGESPGALAPAYTLDVAPEDWDRCTQAAAALACRWAALWADERAGGCAVFSLLEHAGDYLLLRTVVPGEAPRLASQTPHYPAADRMERHARDLLGVEFPGHPDPRRWTRHQAWPEDCYPLRADCAGAPERRRATPPDGAYPFAVVHGAGVNEIPVGPVHAGIIEPGHFRFQAVGEEILGLDARLGYVHKGIEKIAVGRDPQGLARLAGRVSGDTTVAHAWAACQAVERAAGGEPPPRAAHLRALLAERERVANHLGDIGAVCNDVSFSFAHYQCARLREQWQRRSRELFGHRFMMDCIAPGGVAIDIDGAGRGALRGDHAALRRETAVLFDIIDDHPSLEDRLLGTGRLGAETARRLGVLGYVGKASGQGYDVRRANAYAPYRGLAVEVPVFQDGDVAARLRVRMEEIAISLRLMDRLLDVLPEGEVRAPAPAPAAHAEGLGIVEGWRGEIVTYVRFDAEGRIARFFPRDPSWLTWPALEHLIHGNIVPDFPVCNKSINGSYSGQDL